VVTLLAGGAKKRVGGRAVDTSLLPQPTVAAVSSISLGHPGPDATAYSSNTASGSGARAGAAQTNYSALSVQPNTLPPGHSGIGARLGSTQPSQINFALQVHPSSVPSSHSSVGTRTGGSQRAQVDFSSLNDR